LDYTRTSENGNHARNDPPEGWRTIVLYCLLCRLWYNWYHDSKQRRGGRGGWAP
jgi:hypothetical protein